MGLTVMPGAGAGAELVKRKVPTAHTAGGCKLAGTVGHHTKSSLRIELRPALIKPAQRHMRLAPNRAVPESRLPIHASTSSTVRLAGGEWGEGGSVRRMQVWWTRLLAKRAGCVSLRHDGAVIGWDGDRESGLHVGVMVKGASSWITCESCHVKSC